MKKKATNTKGSHTGQRTEQPVSRTLILADGSLYTGELDAENRPHGSGVMSYASGAEYEGEWRSGKRSGTGSMTYPDGSSYDGTWENDEKNGTGRYLRPDGSVYEGDFADGMYHGTGTLTEADGASYTGAFRNGEFDGMGRMAYAGGTIYDGMWREGLRDGKGICTYQDGRSVKGIWMDDRLIGAAETSSHADETAELRSELAALQEKLRDAAQLAEENKRLRAELDKMIKEQKCLAQASDGDAEELRELREAHAEDEKQIRALQRKLDKMAEEKKRLAQASEEKIAGLQAEVDALQEKLAALSEKETPDAPDAPAETVIRRIEEILAEYLDTLSEEAEQQLAVRFRETAFALMDCSVEEASKVMRSPIIGTDRNKRQLRNQARRANRLDIAQMV